MKNTVKCLLVVLFFVTTNYVQAKGCEYDEQCKGERICVSGKCVYVDDGNDDNDDDDDDDDGNYIKMYCCDQNGYKRCPMAVSTNQGDMCNCPGIWGTGYQCK